MFLTLNFQFSIVFMDNIIEEITGSEYKYGFVTNVDTEMIAKGLNEEVIRTISAKKGDAALGSVGYSGN